MEAGRRRASVSRRGDALGSLRGGPPGCGHGKARNSKGRKLWAKALRPRRRSILPRRTQLP
eukprot:2344461-Alexandrium_andersonii.AAC.1